VAPWRAAGRKWLPFAANGYAIEVLMSERHEESIFLRSELLSSRKLGSSGWGSGDAGIYG